MYENIDENEIAHYIDEHIEYYVGDLCGFKDCWMFKYGALTNHSQALSGLDGIRREIGIAILQEIRKRAIATYDSDGAYYVVPIDAVIDVYDNYEYKPSEPPITKVTGFERVKLLSKKFGI